MTMLSSRHEMQQQCPGLEWLRWVGLARVGVVADIIRP